MKKKIKNFAINSFILTLSNTIFRMFSILFTGYVSNKVGSEILGTYSLVMSVYTFAIILGGFGIDFATIRLVSEALSNNNNELVCKFSQKCIFFSGICGLIAGLMLGTFSHTITDSLLHNQIKLNVIFLMCLALPFISMSSSIYGYFVAVRRVYKATIAQFFEQISKLFITYLSLNYYANCGLKYVCFSLILGDLISEIVAFIINYFLYLLDVKKYKTSYHTFYHFSYFYKKIFFLSIPVAITSIIRTGIASIKQFIIPISFSKSIFSYSESLSIYGKINGMAFPIILFPSIIFKSFSSLLVPEFSEFSTQNKFKKIKKTVKVILFTSTALAFFISSILYLFANYLSKLIYNTSEIGIYIKILAPVTIFILLDNVIDNILRGLNKQNNVMYINILDLVVTTALIYLIVPKFSTDGYIFCIYFSEIFNIILSFCGLKRNYILNFILILNYVSLIY